MGSNEDAKDPLGGRMKSYEMVEAQRRLMPLVPTIIRLDGRSFHVFTKGLDRPFDTNMMRIMEEVTTFLVKESNALVGYTQSDEITLVLYQDSWYSQTYFDGRIQKIISTLAAMASVQFNKLLPKYLPKKAHLSPTFDCRVWNVPTLEEAANAVMWREWDATKNSISMAALTVCSHAEIHGLNGKQKQELMFQKGGINWNDYPAAMKRGTYVLRRVTYEPFRGDIESLPPKHHARLNPDLVIERSRISTVVFPPLGSLANKVGVLFQGEEPILRGNDNPETGDDSELQPEAGLYQGEF